MLTVLRDRHLHRQVLALALPMVLSNLTVPLLGLVDAAVVGHLKEAWYLGGVAVGGSMINMTFWLLGFLRMSTTGLSAQAYGAQQHSEQVRLLVQGLALAFGFSFFLLLLHSPIQSLIFQFSDASTQVKFYAEQYFSIRIWGAPAALANFVIIGWLLGIQKAKGPMWMLIVTNVINIVLDCVLVLGLHWKVEGAAIASMVADYCGFALGLWFVVQYWREHHLPSVMIGIKSLHQRFGRLLSLNRDIFLRSLCLQMAFVFMTFEGASLGTNVVAANAVLMSLLMLVSYGMDGFAFAMEALVGQSVGSGNRSHLKRSLIGVTFWSVLIALGFTVAFTVFGHDIIGLISDIPAVQKEAAHYLPWLACVPLLSLWCFLLDGIFIGATRGHDMRNSMFVSILTFFGIWWFTQSQGNEALWWAMLGFLSMRGLSLGFVFQRNWKKNTFL